MTATPKSRNALRIFSVALLSLLIVAGCSRSKRDMPFQTELFAYEGDLEDIMAIPRIVAIRNNASPYIEAIYNTVKIDLKPLTERGTLLVYSESCTVTRIEEQQGNSEVWVFTENRHLQIPGFDPPPAKHVLGVAVIPHSEKPIYHIDGAPVAER